MNSLFPHGPLLEAGLHFQIHYALCWKLDGSAKGYCADHLKYFLHSTCPVNESAVLLFICAYSVFAGNMLTFLVGSKQAFEVSLADVAQTQLQGKNDVMLEFHVDDTTGANEV